MSGISSVIFNGSTLIDLTLDTVEPDKVLEGYTFHSANGDKLTGTYSGGSSKQDGITMAALIPPVNINNYTDYNNLIPNGRYSEIYAKNISNISNTSSTSLIQTYSTANDITIDGVNNCIFNYGNIFSQMNYNLYLPLENIIINNISNSYFYRGAAFSLNSINIGKFNIGDNVNIAGELMLFNWHNSNYNVNCDIYVGNDCNISCLFTIVNPQTVVNFNKNVYIGDNCTINYLFADHDTTRGNPWGVDSLIIGNNCNVQLLYGTVQKCVVNNIYIENNCNLICAFCGTEVNQHWMGNLGYPPYNYHIGNIIINGDLTSSIGNMFSANTRGSDYSNYQSLNNLNLYIKGKVKGQGFAFVSAYVVPLHNWYIYINNTASMGTFMRSSGRLNINNVSLNMNIVETVSMGYGYYNTSNGCNVHYNKIIANNINNSLTFSASNEAFVDELYVNYLNNNATCWFSNMHINNVYINNISDNCRIGFLGQYNSYTAGNNKFFTNFYINFGNANNLNLSYIFANDRSFNSETSNIDMSNINNANMAYAFKNSYINNLYNVKIPSEVWSLVGMFDRCYYLDFNTIDIIPKSKSGTMDYLFNGCSLFNKPINIPDSTISMSHTFRASGFNQEINIPNNIIWMDNTFSSCSFFDKPVNIFSPNIKYLSNTFAYCRNLSGPIRIHLSNNLNTMFYTFMMCNNLKDLYLNVINGESIYRIDNIRYLLQDRASDVLLNIYCNDYQLYKHLRNNYNSLLARNTFSWTDITDEQGRPCSFNSSYNVRLYDMTNI